MDEALLRRYLTEGRTLVEIGLIEGKDPSTVSYWLKKHGLRAVNSSKHAPRGGIDEDVLELLAEEGASLSEMAAELGRSIATVRFWLRRYGLRSGAGGGVASSERRPRRARDAHSNGV